MGEGWRKMCLVAGLGFSCLAHAEFEVTWDTFPVQGRTPSEIMRGLYPGRSPVQLGTTALEATKIDFQVLSGHAGCFLANITIRGKIKVRTPVLSNRQDVDVSTGIGWDRFAAEVLAHERKHVDIWQSAYADLAARLARFEGSECQTGRPGINGETASWRAMWEGRQNDLDAREGHVGSERIRSILSSGTWF